MKELILLISVFLVAVVVHELTHLIVLKLLKIKYKWYFRFWGVGFRFNKFLITPIKYFLVLYPAVVIGFIPCVLSDSNTLCIAYLIACIIDIVGLIECFFVEPKDRFKTYYEIVKESINNYEKKLNKKAWGVNNV